MPLILGLVLTFHKGRHLGGWGTHLVGTTPSIRHLHSRWQSHCIMTSVHSCLYRLHCNWLPFPHQLTHLSVQRHNTGLEMNLLVAYLTWSNQEMFVAALWSLPSIYWSLWSLDHCDHYPPFTDHCDPLIIVITTLHLLIIVIPWSLWSLPSIYWSIQTEMYWMHRTLHWSLPN